MLPYLHAMDTMTSMAVETYRFMYYFLNFGGHKSFCGATDTPGNFSSEFYSQSGQPYSYFVEAYLCTLCTCTHRITGGIQTQDRVCITGITVYVLTARVIPGVCLFCCFMCKFLCALIAFLIALQWKCENLLGEKQPKFTETSTPHLDSVNIL